MLFQSITAVAIEKICNHDAHFEEAICQDFRLTLCKVVRKRNLAMCLEMCKAVRSIKLIVFL